MAAGQIEPRAQPRRRDQLAQQRFGFRHLQGVGFGIGGIFGQGAGDDLGLQLHAGQPFLDQAAAAGLHADHAAGQDQQRQGIERDDAPGEGGEVRNSRYSL